MDPRALRRDFHGVCGVRVIALVAAIALKALPPAPDRP